MVKNLEYQQYDYFHKTLTVNISNYTPAHNGLFASQISLPPVITLQFSQKLNGACLDRVVSAWRKGRLKEVVDFNAQAQAQAPTQQTWGGFEIDSTPIVPEVPPSISSHRLLREFTK